MSYGQSMMKIFLACILLLPLGCSSNPKDTNRDSVKAAAAWFSARDKADKEFLWQHASYLARFKESKTTLMNQWIGERDVYGGLIKRELQLNFEVNANQFPEVPGGVFRRIVYWSKYEKRDLVKEELLLSFETDEWKVLQYRAQ